MKKKNERENSNPTLSLLLLIAMISMAIMGIAKSQSNRYTNRQLHENHVKLMEGRLKMLNHRKKTTTYTTSTCAMLIFRNGNEIFELSFEERREIPMRNEHSLIYIYFLLLFFPLPLTHRDRCMTI